MHKLLAPFILPLLMGAITGCMFNPPRPTELLVAPDGSVLDAAETTTSTFTPPVLQYLDAGFPVVVPIPQDAGNDSDAGNQDVGELDAGFNDAGIMDSGTLDTGVPDAGIPPVASCATGATVGQTYANQQMVGCTGNAIQSTAHMLCGPGSHLCNLGEYAARGGGTAPVGDYWLKSCLIDDGVPQGAPTLNACPTSVSGTLPVRITTDWDSNGNPIDDSGNANTGVAARPDTQCHRLGTDPAQISADCVYAQNYGAFAEIGAMCCANP